jgi:hypothetical protein
VFGVGELVLGVAPVLQQQLHPLQGAGSVGEYAGRIAERLERLRRIRSEGFCPPRLAKRVEVRALFSYLGETDDAEGNPYPLTIGEAVAHIQGVEDLLFLCAVDDWNPASSEMSTPLEGRSHLPMTGH